MFSLDWLETIREARSFAYSYDCVVNPLSLSAAQIPRHFEVAGMTDVRHSNKIITPEAMVIQIASRMSKG